VITPKFVPIVSITGLVSLVLCGVLAWYVQDARDAETQRDCERTVAFRGDSRAMWLYLVDSTPDADPKRVEAFVKELNDRLPRLECRDGNAVPVEP
jgi:hypothetical protein